MKDRHPLGLYVLFATEMWERFSFYSMVALFTLYLQNPDEGFGWTKAQSVDLYANYNMFVYASPLIGGILADRILGYRRAVMIGGFFFMAGHALLAIRSLTAVYAALTCLVIGNGFFKPNVSTMVGNLYPEGSTQKDQAYNIFYMGINIGAFLGPVACELVQGIFGFHAAFALAAGGMVISVLILWYFRSLIESSRDRARAETVDLGKGDEAPQPIDAVSPARRIGALCVVYLIVIVFWMAFMQNGSTLTFWANDNTDWNVSGIISNAINPFWVVTLTFPLVWLWRFLNTRGLEPSTPMKMAFGMFFTALSFLVLYFAARTGEATVSPGSYAYKVSPLWLVSSYALVSLAELMLSPMGLSLVSKVAPKNLRGLMMGGWFLATAIGNKLTMIGVYWEEWSHSSFFAVLGLMAAVMGVVLIVLLRPLKQAMPGV